MKSSPILGQFRVSQLHFVFGCSPGLCQRAFKESHAQFSRISDCHGEQTKDKKSADRGKARFSFPGIGDPKH